jgi:hypothetical protein
MDDIINYLGTFNWYSKLDAAAGFWQLAIAEKDRHKTAFSNAYGQFEFCRMAFGLVNGPAYFQKAMSIMLDGLLMQTCACYMDDINVVGTNFTNHIINLKEVFRRCRKYNCKLKPSKCELACKQTKFLGKSVSPKGIGILKDRVGVIRNWPVPKDVTSLKRFLGFTNWHRDFVTQYAEEAIPLYELTKKGVPYVWGERQQTAFEALKSKLISAPCLAYALPEGKFHVWTDSSGKSMGALLYQEQMYEGKKKLRLISCFSAVYTPAQTRWCSSRLELLALIRALREYRHYLVGAPFKVVTDCRAVSFLFRFKNPQGVIARMQEEASSYDFEIQHRPGTQLVAPDALSRLDDPLVTCECYSSGSKPEDLPCGGCPFCRRCFEQWSQFEEDVLDVMPLGTKKRGLLRSTRHFEVEDQLARTVKAPE